MGFVIVFMIAFAVTVLVGAGSRGGTIGFVIVFMIAFAVTVLVVTAMNAGGGADAA